MTSELPTAEEVLDELRVYIAALSDLQRKMDPIVNIHDASEMSESAEQDKVAEALNKIQLAWWDVLGTMTYLKAAERRLRDKGGSLADIE